MDLDKIQKEVSAPGIEGGRWLERSARELPRDARVDLTKITPIILTGIGLGEWMATGKKHLDMMYWDRPPRSRYDIAVMDPMPLGMEYDEDGYKRSKDGYRTRTLGIYYPPIGHIDDEMAELTPMNRRCFYLFGTKIRLGIPDHEMTAFDWKNAPQIDRRIFVYLERHPRADFWQMTGGY